MSKRRRSSRPEDALVQRAEALRQTSQSYQPNADRYMRRLENIEPDIARMRGSLGLGVAAGSKFNPANTNQSLEAALGRAKTLSTAAAQGEGQLRTANAMMRINTGNKAARREAMGAEGLGSIVSRRMEWDAAKKGAKSIRSAARNNLYGTVAGAAVSGLTYPKTATPSTGSIPTGSVSWSPEIASNPYASNFYNALPKGGPG